MIVLIYGMVVILIVAALVLPLCAFILAGRISDAESSLSSVEDNSVRSAAKTKSEDVQTPSERFRYTFPMP